MRFIIGGDGPKRVRLEEMREKYGLQDRVEMLGVVPHSNVRDVTFLYVGRFSLTGALLPAQSIHEVD